MCGSKSYKPPKQQPLPPPPGAPMETAQGFLIDDGSGRVDQRARDTLEALSVFAPIPFNPAADPNAPKPGAEPLAPGPAPRPVRGAANTNPAYGLSGSRRPQDMVIRSRPTNGGQYETNPYAR